MAIRGQAVRMVRHTLEHPFECIQAISRYVNWFYTNGIDVPYSHIWTSYIANGVGLDKTQAPLTASCDKGANWFRRRKRYKMGQAYGGNYIPCPGDYVYCSSTHEQVDATDVGIVMDSDGIMIQFVHWEDGCPKTVTWYNHNPLIIGYGIPVYEDVREIEMPQLATKGDGVAIAGEDTYVYISPDSDTKQLGILRRGHSVEVLGVTPTGWLKVVWGLAYSGYGYIDNTKFCHKVIKDETPYQKYEGFKIGDKVYFDGGRLYKQPTKGKCRLVNPFTGTIDGDKNEMFHLSNGKVKGWVDKTNVDFVPEIGYNKRKGEITTDKACLRIGPGREFTKVQKWPQMAKGNIVDILGVDIDSNYDEWRLIVIGGVKGYVEDYCVNDIEA